MTMTLTFRPMDEPSVFEILAWRYDPPYDLYNPGAGGAEETMRVFMDPQYAYRAVKDGKGGLVAYCCFGADARVPGGDYGLPALDVGLGVRPDLTGQGRGAAFVDAVLDYARRTFAPERCRVTIAGFNRRARRVWEKAAFRQAQVFSREKDGLEFVVMVREMVSSQ